MFPDKPRLLLVDYSQPILDAVGELFARDGWDVRTAADGTAALVALRSAPPPDMVVSDVAMPPLTGGQLLDAMRSDPSLAPIPVILYSSHFLDPEDCSDLIARGAEA